MKVTTRDYVLCGAAVGVVLAFSAVGVWLVQPWTRGPFGDYHVLIDLVVGLYMYGLLSAALVRTLLRVRPLAPGTYEAGSRAFGYWMVLTTVYRLGQSALAPLIPFYLQPVIERLFGARVGRDVALGGCIDDPYRVSLGHAVVLGKASLVTGNYLDGGKLFCGTVTIGDGATVGANCVIFPDTEIGAGATVVGGSYVIPGTRIPAGELWRGNPARKWLVRTGTSGLEQGVHDPAHDH